MIEADRVLVVDVDGTLCEIKEPGSSYADAKPRMDVVARLAEYRAQGFHVILHSSRNMQTYDGNLGRINAKTAPVLLEWLDRHGIEYDEIYFGKPWPGRRGFYIDDRTVRPDEFVRLSYEEVLGLVDHD